MYGLQEAAKMQAANFATAPAHPMADKPSKINSTGGVIKAVEMLENELQIQRNLIISLAEKLDNYTDKADLNAPTTGVEPTRAYRCGFEQRLHMSLDNVENTNMLLRILLDRVQL